MKEIVREGAKELAHRLDVFLAESGHYMPEATYFRIQDAKDELRQIAHQPELKLDPPAAIQLVRDARSVEEMKDILAEA